MNIEKSKKLLKKIDRLLNNLVEDGEEATVSERKLLISYLHELEDLFSDGMDAMPEAEQASPQAIVEQVNETIEEVEEEVIDEEELEEEIIVEEVIDEAMDDLFNFEDSDDLSGKFASSPIADLTKAMGLNEKILTINELFNGNASEYEKTMADLNGLTDFDEAKKMLVTGAATQYEWLTDNKRKKAIHFIKLIRRRYN